MENHFVLEHDIIFDLLDLGLQYQSKNLRQFNFEFYKNLFIWANQHISSGNENASESIKNKLNQNELIDCIFKYSHSEDIILRKWISEFLLI